ncbi:hypothetical protein AC1031_003381 [Aphanomyces cochlioides]|nr:hypothetical protein AC1031_003381 [Aphanomyces cochlioides]
MARKRKQAAVTPPIDARWHVQGPSGRKYIVLDRRKDEITPRMWNAIEAFEDNHLSSSTQVVESQAVVEYQDICPESPEASGNSAEIEQLSVQPSNEFQNDDEWCPASPESPTPLDTQPPPSMSMSATNTSSLVSSTPLSNPHSVLKETPDDTQMTPDAPCTAASPFSNSYSAVDPSSAASPSRLSLTLSATPLSSPSFPARRSSALSSSLKETTQDSQVAPSFTPSNASSPSSPASYAFTAPTPKTPTLASSALSLLHETPEVARDAPPSQSSMAQRAANASSLSSPTPPRGTQLSLQETHVDAHVASGIFFSAASTPTSRDSARPSWPPPPSTTQVAPHATQLDSQAAPSLTSRRSPTHSMAKATQLDTIAASSSFPATSRSPRSSTQTSNAPPSILHQTQLDTQAASGLSLTATNVSAGLPSATPSVVYSNASGELPSDAASTPQFLDVLHGQESRRQASIPSEEVPPSQHLDAVQVLVSLSEDCPSIASWLRHEGDLSLPDNDSLETTEDVALAQRTTASSAPPLHDHKIDAWPLSLRRRCHLTPPSSPPTSAGDVVLLWIQTTWRMQDNYALRAAQLLGTLHHLPVVAFCVLPEALFHDVAPLQTTNLSGMRHSVAYMRRQLNAMSIPLHGVYSRALLTPTALTDALLAFRPAAIVTDDAPYLTLPPKCSVAIYSMDSMACVPWRRFVEQVASKADFEKIWRAAVMAEESQDSGDIPLSAPSSAYHAMEIPPPPQHPVPWELLDRPSRADVSEHAAMSFVASLIAVGVSRPALQEELHGRGVTSSLPFLRHGSLSPRYFLDKLRASSKPLYARAIEQCILPADYALHGMRRAVPTSAQSLRFFHQWLPPLTTLPPLHQATAAYLPHQLEASRTQDAVWNDMQTHLRLTGYLHPIFTADWCRRLFSWSPSVSAGVGMVEALVMRYSIGASPAVLVATLLSLHEPQPSIVDDSQHLQPVLAQLDVALKALAHSA